MNEVVLVRYGEIFLKGDNRSFFERRLRESIKRAVAPLGGTLERVHGRVLIRPGEAGALPIVAAVERVFGVTSVSRARIVERELPAIFEAAVAEAEMELKRIGGRPTFKVESRRADKRFMPASPEISRLAGAAIVEKLNLPVDVHKPVMTVQVEVGYEQAFVLCGSRPGPGGLPVGVSGHVDLLLSGGIDSPVAGWLMLKRGCQLGATYFHSFPYTGEKTKDKVVALAKKLAAWQQLPVELAVVGFTDTQKQLRDASGDGRLAVVLYRRMMMRVAEKIAYERGAKALVTGEALAQVASQTLENMSVINSAVKMAVLRPCLAHDKQETVSLARKIGTFETSILPYDDCCSLFVPDHPATHAKMRDVEFLESRLNLDALIQNCLSSTEKLTINP